MWQELVRRWVSDDPFQPDDLVRQHYQAKFDLVARRLPKTICEFGVRSGYGGFAMLAAAPGAYYLGYDTDGDESGGIAGYVTRHARRILREFNVHIELESTHALASLPTTFDLIHVDADHRYDAALHDIHLASKHTSAILVDDYTHLDSVRQAVDDWVARNEVILEAIGDPLRGAVLLTPKGSKVFQTGSALP
jgi:predicted O-methyltransferase YrrM